MWRLLWHVTLGCQSCDCVVGIVGESYTKLGGASMGLSRGLKHTLFGPSEPCSPSLPQQSDCCLGCHVCAHDLGGDGGT